MKDAKQVLHSCSIVTVTVMQVRWQCIREFFSLALDFISNNNNNNNKSLFHQKIELLILCYNNTEDYNMEDIYIITIYY